jgi:diacylglycerol kinase family enzyme
MDEESIMTTSIFSARHFFVVNPVCFNNRLKMEAVITEIHHFFNGLKNSPTWKSPEYAIHISRFPRDAIWAIQRFASAVPSGAPLRVYAVGGTGTLFDCLNGVIELSNVELGVIPYKKEVDFYRAFKVENMEVLNSLAVQTCAPSVPVDVLYCGSNYALNHCLVGMEALSRANTKRARKGSAFLDRCISEFLHTLNINSMCFIGITYPELLKQNYHMWVDDKNMSGKYAFINISNSPSYTRNKKHVILEADPTDGCLDVLTCGEMKALKSINVINKYVNGDCVKHSNLIRYQQAKKIFLSSSQPLILDLDGEIFYDKYISVEVIPKKVRIIVPAQVHQE